MDLRRLLNVAYAHLTRDLPADRRRQLDAELGEKFEHEMTREELRRLEYRRKAAELGIDLDGQRQLMDAFALKPARGRA